MFPLKKQTHNRKEAGKSSLRLCVFIFSCMCFLNMFKLLIKVVLKQDILLKNSTKSTVEFFVELFRFNPSKHSVNSHKYKPYTNKYRAETEQPQADTAYTIGVNVEEEIRINEGTCAEIVEHR